MIADTPLAPAAVRIAVARLRAGVEGQPRDLADASERHVFRRARVPALIDVAEAAVGLVEWFDDAAEDGDWCPVCGNDIDELTTLWIPHKAHCPWPGLRAALARLADGVGDG